MARITYWFFPATLAMCSTWSATTETVAFPGGATKYGAKLTLKQQTVQVGPPSSRERVHHDHSVLLTITVPDEC
jgi:hypothetical protein